MEASDHAVRAHGLGEHHGAGIGALLRRSRLVLLDEIDWRYVEMLSLVMDQARLR